MKSAELLKSRLALGTATALVASYGLMGTSVAAQDASDLEAEETTFEEVVVTGSRIRRTNIDTVEPAVVLDREVFDKRAVSNIADLLNETPAFGAPAASPIAGQNSFSVGQNIVDFLGLGSQRTLTLVNGRRYVSSNPPTVFGETGGLQVDFNTIPLALVERIETIATGGAPTYGSDAIAGTINVILRDDFEGFEVQGRYGVSDYGDADSYQVQATMGGNFADDRGNVALAIEYNRQQGLARQARPMFSTDTDQPYIVESSSTTIDGEEVDVWQIFENQRVDIVTWGGLVSPTSFQLPSLGFGAMPDGNWYQFAPNGDLVNYTPGNAVGGSPFFAQGGDGIDLFDRTTQIRSPLERIVISGFSHYDLTDNITAFAEFTFANSEAKELSNQTQYQTFAFGDDSDALALPVSHPLLSDQAYGVLTGLGFTDDDVFYVSRTHNDITGDGVDATENFLWRVVAGLEGEVELGGRTFFWDVSANYGQSDVETRGIDLIDQRFLNALDAIRLTDADLQALVDDGFAADLTEASTLLVSQGGTETANAGDVVCRSVLQAVRGEITGASGSGIVDSQMPFVDGCVPLNIFGEGASSQAARDWVTGLTMSTSDLQQQVYSANFGGDIFDLPAGGLGFAVGYEHRQESASFVPSGFDALGLGRSSAIAGTSGSYKTDEFYGELFIPVISPDMDIPFIHSFDISPKVRYVDNSLAGGDTTYTLGGTLAPVKDLKFRGNYTRSIRSPSLVELFSPVVSTFDFADDPCDMRHVDEGTNPDARAANCAAEGIDTTTFISNIQNASVQGRTGGNADLQNETADSWTLGAVIQPRWVPGLSLTVDYINIKMKNRITSLSVEQMLAACYDSVDFPAPVCDNFSRDDSGQVVDFVSGQANAALSQLQAVTVDINYNFDVASALGIFNKSWKDRDFGTMDLRLNGIRRIENAFSVIGEEPSDTTGEFGENRKSATFDMTYNRGPLQVFWRIAYQDSAYFDAMTTDVFEDLNGNFHDRTGDRFIHNMSVSYEIFDGVVARAAVNNVFDRRGTYLQRATGNITSGIERLGRNFTFTLKASF